MANDKDFIVKNAVEVGGSTKTTLGTVTNDDIDLSTGNYFAHSPSGATTYTISNAGDVQSFQVEVTGGTEEVAQNFSTTTYTGNGGTQTITNGIDLATDGGLVWTKGRNIALYNALTDTERGGQYALYSNTTDAQVDRGSDFITSFNSDGYSIGADGLINDTYNYVSWTFKKAAGFFDIVTYTGDGTGAKTISHNLGTTVGCLIIKKYSTAGQDWFVYHRSAGGADYVAYLNATAAFSNPAYNVNVFNNTAPTDSVFSVNSYTNTSGENYVAYLFAHDTAADGLIQCGSYTGNGSASGPSINLGWEPQWLLLKNATTGGNSWGIIDNQRGITGNEAYLFAQANWGEDNTVGNFIDTTSTGFDVKSSGSFLNGSGDTIIYIAIRSAADLDLTWPTSIEWAGGVSPAAPATGETDLFSISTDDGGTTYQGFKVADNLS